MKNKFESFLIRMNFSISDFYVQDFEYKYSFLKEKSFYLLIMSFNIHLL